MHMALAEYENFLEQKFSRIHNHIKNMRSKMPDHILSMNFGEMQELLEKHNVKTYDQLNELSAKNNAPVAEVPNNRSNATFSNRSARPVSRTDDGMYILVLYNNLCLNGLFVGITNTLYSLFLNHAF